MADLTPEQQMLRYCKQAAEILEVYDAGEPLPQWAQIKIREAARSLGMAVSYLRSRRKTDENA